MSDGVWEYVTGNMVEESTSLGTFYSNSDSGTWDYIPKLKYYDSYEYDTSDLAHERGKLGDATNEVIKVFGTSISGGWYGNRSRFPSLTNVWFLRGGSASYKALTGAFAFGRDLGVVYDAYGFRSVLVLE